MKHVIAVAALALLAACTAHHTDADSKSNWLRSCSARSECPQDADCVCGVCTKPCESADACSGLSSGQALCLDPDQQGLPECGGDHDPVSASRICLLACKQNAECGTAQSCFRGVCISATLADAGAMPVDGRPDAGPNKVPPVQGARDAGTTVPPGQALDAGRSEPLDAGKSPPGALDAGTQIVTLDAGHTRGGGGGGGGGTTPPPDPDSDDAGVIKGPDGCPVGLVRHLNGNCVEAGVDDANGVAMLDSTVRQYSTIFAADLEYVYGVSNQPMSNYGGKLVRWPADGGEGQAMAMSTVFQFVYGVSAVIDADRLYFIAAADPGDLSLTLWSMPKDDSAPPTAHGFAGRLLAQDQDYLYFTNDGDSRVVRIGKSTLDSSQMTEQVYVSSSDAPNTIVALAMNSDSLFVTEVPPHSDLGTFTVEHIVKATNAITTLATSERFSGWVGSTVADDTYFVLSDNNNYVDRLSLATGEIKPFAIYGIFLQLEAGMLYGANGNATKSGGLWRLNLAAAHRQNFLTEYGGFAVRSTVEEGGTIFATVYGNGSTQDMLVRVTPQP